MMLYCSEIVKKACIILTNVYQYKNYDILFLYCPGKDKTQDLEGEHIAT